MKLETCILYSIRGSAKLKLNRNSGVINVHVRSTAKVVTFVLGHVVTIVLGQVVTIVLGQVVTTVTTLGRLVPLAQPVRCVMTMVERTQFILPRRVNALFHS